MLAYTTFYTEQTTSIAKFVQQFLPDTLETFFSVKVYFAYGIKIIIIFFLIKTVATDIEKISSLEEDEHIRFVVSLYGAQTNSLGCSKLKIAGATKGLDRNLKSIYIIKSNSIHWFIFALQATYRIKLNFMFLYCFSFIL